MRATIKTYKVGDSWTLVDWKPGMPLRVSPWTGNEPHNQSRKAYRVGQKVSFPYSNMKGET